MGAMPELIKENTPERPYTKYYQLYKELINVFFEEFLAVYFRACTNTLI